MLENTLNASVACDGDLVIVPGVVRAVIEPGVHVAGEQGVGDGVPGGLHLDGDHRQHLRLRGGDGVGEFDLAALPGAAGAACSTSSPRHHRHRRGRSPGVPPFCAGGRAAVAAGAAAGDRHTTGGPGRGVPGRRGPALEPPPPPPWLLVPAAPAPPSWWVVLR